MKDQRSMRLWGGRFADREVADLDRVMEQLNASITFDWRLYDADITGSIAYATALARAGLIEPGERDDLRRGLEQIKSEFASGSFEIRLADEDIHTAVERRLHEIVGPVAGKLHTGRSRNDQVATDLRLHLRGVIDAELEPALRALQQAIVTQAREARDLLMPGYTHLQRAQPVPVAHWLLQFFWPLQRDRERLADLRRRVNVLPLGAGALAGNAVGIDRAFLAEELGFERVTQNSMDAVADRDFVAEMLFCGAMIGLHLSRVAEDIVIYSSAEFGFVSVAEAFSTGSSLMPQKKNPDSMELARGKSGRLVGNLLTLLTVLKGLPSTYNKDLQEDKEPLFDTLDTLLLTLPVVAGVVQTLTFNQQRMSAALDDSMLATDLADELVRGGTPFREAHGLVGRLVRRAETLRVRLQELPSEDVAAVHPLLAANYQALFDMRRSVDTRTVTGGTASAALTEQLHAAEAACGKDEARVG
jgi:argininosuccinate lyase